MCQLCNSKTDIYIYPFIQFSKKNLQLKPVWSQKRSNTSVFMVFCFYFQTSNHRKNWSHSSWGKSLYFPHAYSPRMGSLSIISQVFVCFTCSWIRTEIIISNSFSPAWRPCTHCWAVKVESVSNTGGIFATRNCFLHKTKILLALMMKTSLLGKKVLWRFLGSSIITYITVFCSQLQILCNLH